MRLLVCQTVQDGRGPWPTTNGPRCLVGLTIMSHLAKPEGNWSVVTGCGL